MLTVATYIKKISVVVALILALNVASASVSAAEVTPQGAIQVFVAEPGEQGIEVHPMQPMAAAEVAVFIGGIVVAWIVDGILIYTTGHSGGEWVAKALDFHKESPSCTNIYFSSATGSAICHSGSRGGF